MLKKIIAKGDRWTIHEDGTIHYYNGVRVKEIFIPECPIFEFLSLWRSAVIGHYYIFCWAVNPYIREGKKTEPGVVKFLGFPGEYAKCKECCSTDLNGVYGVCNNCGEWQNEQG